jgi:hypothetical protein
MTIEIKPDGSLSLDPLGAFETFLNFFSSLGKSKKQEAFLETLEYMSNHRSDLARIAGEYYTLNGYQLIHPKIPLLAGENFYYGELKNIDDVLCTYDRKRTQVELKNLGLPDAKKNYVQSIIDIKYGGEEENSPFKRNFCYRLVDVKSPTQISFEHCDYFDYINTCEYQFYLFAAQIKRNLKNNIFEKKRLKKLKREIEPFNLSNRYHVPGINTLLIFWEEDNPCMYIHKRNKKTTAEAINVKHIVPAGTFQPIHMDDANHEHDFSMYTNILREFGEELAGDRELIHPHGVLENVLERDSLKPIDSLIKAGVGQVYYGGITYDCLTLKPEILSIMVIQKKDFEEHIGPVQFIENYEGEPFAVQFNKQTLRQYCFDPEMLPAGAGCLYLALEHFERIEEDMRKSIA